MNPAAILALIAELYSQVAQLRQENEELRAQRTTPSNQEVS